MRRLVVPTLLVLAVLTMLGCGKYSDAIQLNRQYIDLMDQYLSDLDESGSAADVAKAMNDYADELEVLWPKMQAVSEKYPELKDRSNQPEEMKASQQEVEEVAKRFGSSMMKVMPYMRDAEVRKAQKRLQGIMIS